jgi:hypothetical protein
MPIYQRDVPSVDKLSTTFLGKYFLGIAQATFTGFFTPAARESM